MIGSEAPLAKCPEKNSISFYEEQDVVTNVAMEHRQRKHRRSMLRLNASILFQLVILVANASFCLWLYTKYQRLREANTTSKAEAHFAVLHDLDYHATLQEMKNAHHGIATSEVAHIYGDDEVLESYMGKVPPGGNKKLMLRRSRNLYGCTNKCANYKNKYSDFLFSLPKDTRFSLGSSDGEHVYRYFSQANWMNDSSSNYIFRNNCKIQVKSNGMYQIYGHIQFVIDQGISDGSMRIRRHRNGTNTTLGGCYMRAGRIPGNRYGQKYHCSAYKVGMLKKHDEIYIDIQAFSIFLVDKDKLHLTVIKLNSESIDEWT